MPSSKRYAKSNHDDNNNDFSDKEEQKHLETYLTKEA